jgi:hypothetical protein
LAEELTFSERTFSSWPQLEQELRHALTARLEATSVSRVMNRAQQAYFALQLPNLVGSLDLEHAAQIVRYETWSRDFQSAQARMFTILIDSFIALEVRPNQSKAWLF